MPSYVKERESGGVGKEGPAGAGPLVRLLVVCSFAPRAMGPQGAAGGTEPDQISLPFRLNLSPLMPSSKLVVLLALGRFFSETLP